MNVYAIFNRESGKYYIGMTSLSIESRWMKHCASSKYGSSLPIHAAIRKYGSSTFELICMGCADTHAEIIELERLWILITRAFDNHFGYNLTFGGDGGNLLESTRQKIVAKNKGRKRSPESCQKMKDAIRPRLTEDHKKKLSRIMKLRNQMTPEIQALAMAARRGSKHTEESKLKMSEAKRGRKQSPEVIEKRVAPLRGRAVPMEVRMKISHTKQLRKILSEAV
jgi:group I intron endonuclease